MPDSILLRFFISSTFGLAEQRRVIQKVLGELTLDGRRYEEWPVPSGNPMDACLREVAESDAVIVLLGADYGTPNSYPWSGAETEFRYALKNRIPTFAFEIEGPKDAAQQQFVEHARKEATYFASVSSQPELARELRAAMTRQVAMNWRASARRPPEPLPWYDIGSTGPLALADDRDAAVSTLRETYAAGDDERICATRLDVDERFENDVNALSIFYQSEVNRGLAHQQVRADVIEKASEFFGRLAAEGKHFQPASMHYCRGNALHVLKRYDDAIDSYHAALAHDDEWVECWKNLASAYHEGDRLTEARQAYERALQLDPGKFEALHSLGTLLIHRLHEPRAGLQHLASIDPSTLDPERLAHVRKWQSIGHQALGEYDEALEAGLDAISLAPHDRDAWLSLAKFFRTHRDHRLAIHAVRFFEQYLPRFPNSVEAWHALAFALFDLREHRCRREFSRRAVLAFEKVIELGLDDPLVWDRIGHVWQDEKNWEKAAKAYERAARGDAEHGYCYGFALAELHRYDEALPFALAAAEKHQPDGRSWALVATCFTKLGKGEEAIAAYEKAIAVDPGYVPTWFDLGGLYWNQGHREKALNQWLLAIERFPDAPEARRVRDLLKSHFTETR